MYTIFRRNIMRYALDWRKASDWASMSIRSEIDLALASLLCLHLQLLRGFAADRQEQRAYLEVEDRSPEEEPENFYKIAKMVSWLWHHPDIMF